MKILIENDTNLAAYAFADTATVTLNADHVFVTDETEDINDVIHDYDASNVTLHTSVSNTPDPFIPFAHTFDGSTWSANPDYVDPETLPPDGPPE